MPQTWSQFEKGYDDLEARTLTLDNVDAWLHNWSELEKDVTEAVRRPLPSQKRRYPR